MALKRIQKVKDIFSNNPFKVQGTGRSDAETAVALASESSYSIFANVNIVLYIFFILTVQLSTFYLLSASYLRQYRYKTS